MDIAKSFIRAYGPIGASAIRNHLREQTNLNLAERQAAIDTLVSTGEISETEDSNRFRRIYDIV
ncbi:hypothetical protein LCGC14_0364000 [marine sediment metagenome]|uniref:Uncharacterized protein n=1 Tax=marine sediment metagenome TaxID=412755 RepID=A0A0F9VUB7_9ZZZZ